MGKIYGAWKNDLHCWDIQNILLGKIRKKTIYKLICILQRDYLHITRRFWTPHGKNLYTRRGLRNLEWTLKAYVV